MVKNDGYFYKICKTNGEVYIQIWNKRNAEGKAYYVRSLGSADKCQENLVKYEEREKLTKEAAQNLTKIASSEKV